MTTLIEKLQATEGKFNAYIASRNLKQLLGGLSAVVVLSLAFGHPADGIDLGNASMMHKANVCYEMVNTFSSIMSLRNPNQVFDKGILDWLQLNHLDKQLDCFLNLGNR